MKYTTQISGLIKMLIELNLNFSVFGGVLGVDIYDHDEVMVYVKEQFDEYKLLPGLTHYLEVDLTF